MPTTHLDSDFLRFLVNQPLGEKLPTLNDLSQELGVSVGKLREQLEVARSMGVVSIRPRVGMQREPFQFLEVIRPAVLFSLATEESSFQQLSQLRQAIEIYFWSAAVAQLTAEDLAFLRQLVTSAWEKLRHETAIHVPHEEHRQLHLTIFGRLENPFVQGILNIYWEAYELSELTRLSQYQYWLEVWSYHDQIITALEAQNFALGQQLLVEHFGLLRPSPHHHNGR